MKYQIIQFNREQFYLKPDGQITVNGLSDLKEGDSVKAQILLYRDDAKLEIGTPYLAEELNLQVVKHLKSPKIRVATYRAKSRYRKVKGHRQDQTILAPAAVKSPQPVKAKAK